MPETETQIRDADEDQRRAYWESLEDQRDLKEDLDAPMSDQLIQWILENF